MPDLRSIPEGTKWQLAAQCAARLPAMYDAVFRPVLKEAYDELEQGIWIELAKLSLDIARTLHLPLRNAQEISQALVTVTAVLFGPDYKGEAIEVGEKGAVIMVRRCPLLAETKTVGAPTEKTFHRCMALSFTLQENFNPQFSTRYVRAMCMGDRQCEIKIEPVKKEGDDKTPESR